MPDRKPLRVVHTSDVHLGAYSGDPSDRWRERRELMELTFSRVIDLANDVGAGALLIAGDFFDNDRVGPEVVEFAASQIARFEGRTFLIPGNHDPMDPGKIYWRHDLEAVAPRLRILREHGGEVVEVPELDLVLWGRAYVDSDWHFRPSTASRGGSMAAGTSRWRTATSSAKTTSRTGRCSSRSTRWPRPPVSGTTSRWDTGSRTRMSAPAA